jgi:hypothetical protein
MQVLRHVKNKRRAKEAMKHCEERW